MPSGKYYRAQAELAARLAATVADPQIANGYSRMALEQLAKAHDLEPSVAPPKERPAAETGATPMSGDQSVRSQRRADR